MSQSLPSKILIVDDEPAIAFAIEYLMKDQGYLTEVARDGREALEKLEQARPDLIILDVMMPHLNGFEVARLIRQNEAYQDCRIIFLTARGTDRDKDQGYGSGGDVYLTKPFDNQELVDLVGEILTYG